MTIEQGVIEKEKAEQVRLVCAFCGGGGRHQTTGFYCWDCRGKGLIPIEAGGALV